jgi:hypothetical protein
MACRLVGSLDEVEDLLMMDPEGFEVARKHLDVERMTCLLPVKVDADIAIQCREEIAIGTGVRMAEKGFDVNLRQSMNLEFAMFYRQQVPDIDDMCSSTFPLYVSSGNAHGFPLGQTFQEIVDQFRTVVVPEPTRLLAIDGDHLHDEGEHASTSTIRIAPDGSHKYVREGYHHMPRYSEGKSWRCGEDDLRRWRMRDDGLPGSDADMSKVVSIV